MVFSSLPFLFRYLPIVLILYFIAPRKYRNAVLFFTSLVFYAWGEPIYVLLMLFSTLVDYTHGMLVHHFKQKGEITKAKIALSSAMIINISLLGFFKYSDFAISNINALTGSDIGLLKLVLPIGISFYTFQTMSYTIDIYRGEAEVQKNIISFGAYVVLFPQLIAGPIVQYKTIAKQLQERREDFDQFSYGVLRFMSGLGKKVLLANNIGILWDRISVTPNGELTVVTAWLGITAFAFQIYFDFSGYSDMAIGLGNMLGFQFLENFNYPYMSKSITEFWRRWHISLGTWFRDYVYIPLGGNRCGLGKQIRNIAIVWFLTGFWHGASWNFIMWGVYFGVILILEKFVLLKFLNKLPSFLSHIYAIVLVWIGWAIFAFDDFSKGINYIKAMFGVNTIGFINDNARYLLMNYAIILIVLILGSTDLPKRVANRLVGEHSEKKTTAVVQGLFIVGVFVISVAYLVDASYNPFLYFRF
ncbi:MBOAT family O-acyltransferase [Lachnoclostridium phytofermentans]|uniref:Membrane bound O-acyl transferase MBOAT family protein n=1 Tax=Lachnoclostridium phytofermentans (strain ATCC 700394 / DSM 18823 / ISDg) TaxID=357809 RepID=A9KRY7_LACP7|nr:MBOAT family O-acyltransferase [Lachnoclostridium phytofermentans]ABX40618.1 membrane bound O-acyl transferase MBOAT family protein [Lachnoclostridium phytofermentans ISDg]